MYTSIQYTIYYMHSYCANKIIILQNDMISDDVSTCL